MNILFHNQVQIHFQIQNLKRVLAYKCEITQFLFTEYTRSPKASILGLLRRQNCFSLCITQHAKISLIIR